METKPLSPAVPGMPAPGANPAPVQPATGAQPAANTAAANPLPPGNVVAAKESVLALGGLRGGKPRKDGLLPGSVEAIKRDREKDASYRRDKNERERLARQAVGSVAPLPSGATTGAPESTVATPGTGLGSVPTPALDGWLAEDAAPVVEAIVNTGEAWDEYDNRKILAPLELDAAATSKILSATRWPEKHKLNVIRACPAPAAKLFTLLRIPKSAKDYALGLPSLVLLLQTISENKKNLRALVEEQMARKVPAPKEAKHGT